MLRKRGTIWFYQTKIAGTSWTRSTGESDKKRALVVARRLAEEATLLRQQPGRSLSYDVAVVREVGRVEADLSRGAAVRTSQRLMRFRKWLGKDTPLYRITTDLIDRFQKHRLQEDKMSSDTVSHEVFAVMRLLRENGIMIVKPKRRVGTRTEQRSFTHDEVKAFFAHCPDGFKPLFLLLLTTGMRLAEALPSEKSTHIPLLKTELLQPKSVVVVRQSKQRAGSRPKIREVKIPEDVMQLVVEASKKVEGPHVFEPVIRISRVFDTICENAGIPKVDALKRKVTCHSFRHTYATQMADAVGGNAFALKEIMGHSTIVMTAQYCHPTAPAVVIDLSTLGVRGVSSGCHQAEEVKEKEA